MASTQWIFLASALLSLSVGHVIHRLQSPEIPDESDLPFQVVTRSLPTLPDSSINSRFMPTVGNGHLSSTIYSNQMYMNGLYQGSGSSSHRAMIPTILTPRVTFRDPALEDSAERTYIFNVQTGVFTVVIENEFAYIEQKMYAHQKYTRLFVTNLYATRKGGAGVIDLDYNYPTNLNASNDYSFNRPVDHKEAQHIRAWTLAAEEGASTQNFNLIQYRRTYEVTLNDESPLSNITQIMSVDIDEEIAKAEFDAGADIVNDPERGGYALLREHIQAMSELWATGSVQVSGDLELGKVTYLSQYYLLTSLPALEPNTPEESPSYSHSRTSLGKGGLGADYQGHIFWDSEFCILPAVLPFSPNQARSILDYRRAKFQEAQDNAESYGQEGARYPWESGFSGNDVTPGTCPSCKDQQIFVSAAVSWAIRQYYSATGDAEFNAANCDVTREIARFYDSVITFNDEKNLYEINNVMGPDDFHPNINNNAFINTAAKLTTQYARFFACECGRDPQSEIPDDWLDRVSNLFIPFDETNNVNYQFEGFDSENNKTIKQADAILLTYPLDATQSEEISRNDLEYYAELTSENTPALTHSFAAVGWKQVGDLERAAQSFGKFFSDYVIRPFRIWTEYSEESPEDQASSSVNFISGAGGFLQSLIYGYAGAQFNPTSLEFRSPVAPPGAGELKLNGFKYFGASFDITVDDKGQSVVLINSLGSTPLVLKSYAENAQEISLTEGLEVQVDTNLGFSIYSTEPSQCQQNL